ncbi:MAG: glycosyltransferase family 2 protein, partial [Nitrospina sp.]|nr:glycosyltransferase family 2 protein [Nitrospina sp.]
MFKDKVISIVVPAHNEQKLIQKVLQSIPHWVDHIFVINDGSSDATSEKVRERMESDSRIQLICHKENRGVGAAICSGYKTSLENEVDIAVVMAGDAQMDPENLESLILPVAEEGVDYTKG